MGLQDLRLAVCLWWRNPWFAALTAVGLGLGIGVNNTFFALANAAVIRGLPMTLDDALQQARWVGQVSSLLLYSVGACALALALVGLYAVTAHAVRRRRREIGIRMAVGARAADVLRLILVTAARVVGVGLLAGVACTAAFDRLFTTTTLRLTDAAIMGPTLAAMAVVALAAALVPALGAARVDPVTVLRED